MSKIWVVYVPQEYYDGGDKTLFACPTKAIADACASRINTFASALCNRLPELLPVPSLDLPDDHPDWLAFNNIDDKFEAIRKRARWPYGINLFYERSQYPVVAVMSLPVRTKP